MNANGFLSYLDGIVTCPRVEIQNSIGEMVANSEFAMWKLVELL